MSPTISELHPESFPILNPAEVQKEQMLSDDITVMSNTPEKADRERKMNPT